MTYAVFALIVAAALSYLLLADSVKTARLATTGNRENARLEERIAAIRLSLKDLEYEKSIGKMDAANFERLQGELLSEWDRLDKQLVAAPAEVKPAANNCPSCGAAILAPTAKFCHSCGAKLSV